MRGNWEIREGECRTLLRELPEASVQTVVTSPPYWGLRDYEIEPSVWDGDPDCEHDWGEQLEVKETTYGGKTRWQHVHNGRGEFQEDRADREGWLRSAVAQGRFCGRCGAWLGVLGLEPTPELYIEHLVAVFREVRRVLREDGTVWLNLGDAYCTKQRGSDRGWDRSRLTNPGRVQKAQRASLRTRPPAPGYKHKDLLLLPAQVALALRADGWWVRAENIWSKPNPMPESVDDRPTRSHEQVYLLAKSGTPRYWTHRDGRRGARRHPEPDWLWVHRESGEESEEPQEGPEWMRVNRWRGHDYYWDADGVREQAISEKPSGNSYRRPERLSRGGRGQPHRWDDVGGSRNLRSVWSEPDALWSEFLRFVASEGEAAGEQLVARFLAALDGSADAGAGATTIWEIATQPFAKAHFATFPLRLVQPCVTAGSSPKACAECGAPWERVSRRMRTLDGVPQPGAGAWSRPEDPRRAAADGASHARWSTEVVLCGWQPSCEHGDGEARCLVLDPFAGSGTSGRVAIELGRDFVGLEQNPTYAAMARERIAAWEADPTGQLAGDPEPLPGQLSIEAALDTAAEPAEAGMGS